MLLALELLGRIDLRSPSPHLIQETPSRWTEAGICCIVPTTTHNPAYPSPTTHSNSL